MKNEINKQEFEKLSFWQLLENRSIEIPIIQRDYAQGRAKNKKVRSNFLDALKNALIGNPVELDFIYGSEEKNILQPLDGQQRLTTLFLLHWFIFNKEGKLDIVKERLMKFTYETRISSREFCKELIDKSIDYKNLLQLDKEKRICGENQLSETIKNASWFVISWKNDPTISAMLIMLDSIQAIFKDSSDLWQKLIETKEDIRPITFLYIKLKNFGLSDDLYIKMNARGKALTPFENFKSRFGKHIEINNWEKELNNPVATFSHKIDTVWTDLFWKYKVRNVRRNEDGKQIFEYTIDVSLINFIAVLAINHYSINYTANKKTEVENRLKILFNNPNEISCDDFPTKDAFDYFVNSMELYCSQNNYSDLKSDVNLWKYCKNTLFLDVIQNVKTEWQSRALFYAQTTYLLNNEFDVNSFNDWMRVVRNIVENSAIDDASTYISAVSLIKLLSEGCVNIYKYLSTFYLPQQIHAKDQLKEEIEKAKIIKLIPEAKKSIHAMEDTNYFKGKIGFALYCIDLNFNFEIVEKFDQEKFDNIKIFFDNNLQDLNTKVSDEFKRAFLTIEKGDYYEFWKLWSHSFKLNKRALFRINKDLRDNFSLKSDWRRDYFKALIIAYLSKGSLKKIIDDFDVPSDMPKWKHRLIKEENLLKGATFILFPDNNSFCYLARQPRPTQENQVTRID